MTGRPSSISQLRGDSTGSHVPSVHAAHAAGSTSDLYLDHLKNINSTFYDQLKVVDQKAAYVFTFLIAMMIWSEAVRKHFADAAEPVVSAGWMLSVGLALSLTVAAISAIMVVLPRNRRGGASLYWGAWPEAGAQLAAMRSMQDSGLLVDDYRLNVENLAALCRQKYRMVRLSYLGLLAALVCYVLALTAG